jgi:hypothetical protein
MRHAKALCKFQNRVSPSAMDSWQEKVIMSKLDSLKASSSFRIPMFHHKDIALLLPLAQSMELSWNHINKCVRAGLIPQILQGSFVVLKFLSRTVLAAQKAQRCFGVPASVLIAIAINESAWEVDDLAVAHARTVAGVSCACCSPDIEAWFLAKAKYLSESPEFRDAWPLVHDVRAYVLRLFSLGLGDELDAQDIISIIEDYNLEECDLAALLPPGEYDRDTFTAVRDERGVMQLKPFDLRESIAVCRAPQVA